MGLPAGNGGSAETVAGWRDARSSRSACSALHGDGSVDNKTADAKLAPDVSRPAPRLVMMFNAPDGDLVTATHSRNSLSSLHKSVTIASDAFYFSFTSTRLALRITMSFKRLVTSTWTKVTGGRLLRSLTTNVGTLSRSVSLRSVMMTCIASLCPVSPAGHHLVELVERPVGTAAA